MGMFGFYLLKKCLKFPSHVSFWQCNACTSGLQLLLVNGETIPWEGTSSHMTQLGSVAVTFCVNSSCCCFCQKLSQTCKDIGYMIAEKMSFLTTHFLDTLSWKYCIKAEMSLLMLELCKYFNSWQMNLLLLHSDYRHCWCQSSAVVWH